MPMPGLTEATRAIALRINRAIQSGEDTLTIDLHPAELGRVAVHLAFHNGGVDVQMIISRPETFSEFTRDRQSLEQQFSQAGLDLGDGSLNLAFGRGAEPDTQPSGDASGASSADIPETPQSTSQSYTQGLINIMA